MSKEPIHTEPFEMILKEAADALSKQPSSKVWLQVQSQIRKRRRIRAAALMIGICVGLAAMYQWGVPYMVHHTWYASHKPHLTYAPWDRAHKQPSTEPHKLGSNTPIHAMSPGSGIRLVSHFPHVFPSTHDHRSNGHSSSHPSFSGRHIPLRQHPIKSITMLTGIQGGSLPMARLGIQIPPPGKQAFEKKTVRPRLPIPTDPLPGNNTDTAKGSLPKHPLWEWSLSISPAVGYRFSHLRTAADQRPSGPAAFASIAYLKLPKQLWQQPGFGFYADIHVLRQVRRSWWLGSGLQFSRQAYRITAYPAMAVSIQSNGRSSTFAASRQANSAYSLFAMAAVPNPTEAKASKSNTLESLNVPLWLAKEVSIHHTPRLRITGGLLLSKVIHDDELIFSPYTWRYFRDEELIRPWNLQMNVHATYQFPLSHHWTGAMGPSFQYQVLSTLKSSYPLSSHMYLLGWQLTVRRH